MAGALLPGAGGPAACRAACRDLWRWQAGCAEPGFYTGNLSGRGAKPLRLCRAGRLLFSGPVQAGPNRLKRLPLSAAGALRRPLCGRFLSILRVQYAIIKTGRMPRGRRSWQAHPALERHTAGIGRKGPGKCVGQKRKRGKGLSCSMKR